MLGDIKLLNTSDLKAIIDEPSHISPDGLDYSKVLDDVIAEYKARLATGTKDAVTHIVSKHKEAEPMTLDCDPKRQQLLKRLAKARAAKKHKPEHLKRKGISLTVLDEHAEVLAEAGDGNKSKGLAKILSWYLTYESKIFD